MPSRFTTSVVLTTCRSTLGAAKKIVDSAKDLAGAAHFQVRSRAHDRSDDDASEPVGANP
jgi:hypothetical protein